MRLKKIDEPWAKLSVRALTRCLGMFGAPFDELYSVVNTVPVAWSRVRQRPCGPDRVGGTYTVVYRLDADAHVTVGPGRTFFLPAGYYLYVGTAFGGGGVGARTERHRKPVKARKRWNIDYFTPHARAIEVWWTHDPVRRECTWSAALAALPGFDCPGPGFGASDCRGNRAAGNGAPDGRLCKAHLYMSHRRPRAHDFAMRLPSIVPGHAPVCRLRIDRDVRRGGESGKSSGRVAVPRPVPGSKLESRFRG